MVKTKRCGHCRAILPLDRFTKNKGTATGLSSYCKDCSSDINKTRLPRPFTGNGMGIKMTLSKERFIREYNKHGRNRYILAEVLGVSSGCVGLWAKLYGLTRPARKNMLSDEEFARKYLELNSAAELARSLNVTLQAVVWRVKRIGIEISAEEKRRRWQESHGTNGSYRDNGYVLRYRPEHPSASKGCIRVHRLIVEEAIGRYLTRTEKVHHIDTNRAHNEVSNLAIMSSRDHSRLHRTYYRRWRLYSQGTASERPVAFRFLDPAFWAGKWVTEIDLPGDPCVGLLV